MSLFYKLAKHNNIITTLFEDIRNMDKTWATFFVADAVRLEASAILVVGGFPCKGLSRARGEARENLNNKYFIICWELKRIIDLLEEVAGTDIPIRHIIKHVMMDSEPEEIISG